MESCNFGVMSFIISEIKMIWQSLLSSRESEEIEKKKIVINIDLKNKTGLSKLLESMYPFPLWDLTVS